MKKVLKIVGIVLLVIIVAAIVAFGLYWHHNTHWYDKYEKALKTAGAVEKQITLPNGNVINYGEVSNEKPALLLIHGQMSIWEDYALVLPELSNNWHIYAIDVYGHGESTHNESLYYLDVNGDDLIWFVDHVIGEPTVVAGHSNGALTASYIAAYGGQNIAGAVLEDPPVFSTEGEGWEDSFAYLDTYKPLHDWRENGVLGKLLFASLLLGTAIHGRCNAGNCRLCTEAASEKTRRGCSDRLPTVFNMVCL